MSDEPSQAEPGEDNFRRRARAWLAGNASRLGSPEVQAETRHKYHPDRLAAGYDFHHRLWDAGFAGLTCPIEYGGRGLPQRYQEIWDEEAAPYELPPHGSGASLGIALPLLLAYGSEALKREHIPRILRAEGSWCQFLSEPAAGSDLAGVRTTAVRDGDEFVINGAKVWTSGAHFAYCAMCLVRTDPDVPKHQGLTMVVVPIPAPGIEIRPIRNINGGSDFNEVFLDDVRVPVANVFGAVGDGWRVTQAMLGFERRMLGTGSISGGASGALPPQDLVDLATHHGRVGEPEVRQLIADVWVHTVVAAETAARCREAIQAGTISPQFGSALKLFSEDLVSRRAEAAMTIAGPAGVAWPADEPGGGRWMTAYLTARAASIGGGSTEIQRNIVGERVLGLPREPQFDRDVPFREVPFGQGTTKTPDVSTDLETS